tara:strand:- start:3226 stop:4107 length:882 start_codon:yes stop_codon:yes gene_type:complete
MLKFNKHLAKIHAYLCADGYVITNPNKGRKHYTIGFRNTSKILLSDFDEQFNVYFDIKPKKRIDGRRVVNNKRIYKELTKDHNYYSINWNFPKLSNDYGKYWLQSYFDCEAWVINRIARDRHIGVDSINKEGLLSIQDCLRKIGISSKFKNRGKRTPEQNEIYRLLIYGKNNLIKFQKNINFLHPKKNRKLQEAIDSYVDRNWKIGNDECENQDEKIRKILKGKKGFKKKGTYSICSVKKYNLIHLQKFLKIHLNISSSIYGPKFNKQCCKYYEFNILNQKQSKNLKNFIYPQ